MNSHLLFPPLQMASADGCIPVQDAAKKKKKRKRNESDSEESEYETATKTATKTAPVRFSNRVSASHRIPPALFAHPRRTVRTV